MRSGILLMLMGATSCVGASLQPTVQERLGADLVYVGMYTAGFEVSCDSCRVEYGKEGATYHDVVDGSWRGSLPLGTLRDGERVRVELHVIPVGDARVVSARIDLDGRTVKSGKSDKPGERVSLRARVGPS